MPSITQLGNQLVVLTHSLANRAIFGSSRRYFRLAQEIRRIQAKNILEIGTFTGGNATSMVRAALENQPLSAVHYFGFDLFEDMTPEVFRHEKSKGKLTHRDNVQAHLKNQFGEGLDVQLFMGNTKTTLPIAVKTLPKMDFIFIDGGHSFETVQNDWEYCRQLMHPGTVVIFDDYVSEATMKNAEFGANRVLDSLDRTQFAVKLLNPVDYFNAEWGIQKTRFAKVVLRQPQ